MLPKNLDAKYTITDVSLEYRTQPDLTRRVEVEYESMDLPYERVLRDRQISVNKSDMTWNWSFNMLCKSFKGTLALFKVEQSQYSSRHEQNLQSKD